MPSATQQSRSVKHSKLSREDEELLQKSKKLKKILRYSGNALNIMLTVLNQASAGIPILKNVAGTALAMLENVQLMDDNQGLIAQVILDVIETTFIVNLALQNDDTNKDAPITDQRLLTYIDTFRATLEDIKEKLEHLRKPKGGLFSSFTQSKGYEKKIKDLRELLQTRRSGLHLLISSFTYRGVVCTVPVGSAELEQYAGQLAQAKLAEWKEIQNSPPVVAGQGAAVHSQVGAITAKQATKNLVGVNGTIYNGDNCNGNNTVYNFSGPPSPPTVNNFNGSIGVSNTGPNYGTMNMGCNTMSYFNDPSRYSQEPTGQPQWYPQQQQQQWSGHAQPQYY